MKIERILAPNRGPYTGAGTNTWLLDGGGAVAIIDPGPVDSRQADAIVARVGQRPVTAIVVTHTHEDHAPLANPLGRDLDVPVLGHLPGPGFDPDERLGDGASLHVGEAQMQVVHTPGHSADHLCFLVDRVLFTGDHIIGGSSVMVDEMGSYLTSLRRVRQLDVDRLYPGHGEVMEQPGDVIDWYIAHRLQREAEILQSITGGSATVEDIVLDVYRQVDDALHPLAAMSVNAHVRKLVDEGAIRIDGNSIRPIESASP